MNWSVLSSKNAFSDEKTSFVSLSPSQSRSMKVVQELKKPLSLKDMSQILAWSCYGSKTKGLLMTDFGAVVAVKWLSEMAHKLIGPRFASCKFQTFTCYLKISFFSWKINTFWAHWVPKFQKRFSCFTSWLWWSSNCSSPQRLLVQILSGQLMIDSPIMHFKALTSLLYPCSTQKCRYILLAAHWPRCHSHFESSHFNSNNYYSRRCCFKKCAWTF